MWWDVRMSCQNPHRAQVGDYKWVSWWSGGMGCVFKMNAKTFWSKVNKGSESECWPWNGAGGRYGHLNFEGKFIKSHRMAYILTYGRPAQGLCICHKCDNPRCCNPNHLFTGTHKENSQDAVNKGRLNGRNSPIKFPTIIVEEALRRIANGESQTSVGKSFGISSAHMSYLVNGKTRKNDSVRLEVSHLTWKLISRK